MKKGVVHLLEAILVSLTFLITVPLLLYPLMIRTDWDYTKLSFFGQDLVATLDKIPDSNGESFLQNIMNRNTTELINNINENFNWIKRKKINYGIKSVGVIKKEIRVGFNCTSCNVDEEIEGIERVLRPCYINGRYVNFHVFSFSYENLQKYDMDVLLIKGRSQRNEANNRMDEIKNNILVKGTGIVGFYNISNGDSLDELETDIFGLRVGGGGGGDPDITFLNAYEPSYPNYGIQKYFYAVGINENFTYKFNEHEETVVTLWNDNYKVRRNDTDSDGIYDSLDIDTNASGVYEILGEGEGYDFSMLNKKDGQTYDFEIEKIDPNGRFFILNFKRSTPYHFQNFVSPPHRPIQSDKGDSYEVLKTSSARCGIVVNGTDNSVWRSVWISEGSGDDINALVKSSIMWASKKEWWNVLKTVSGKYNKISYFVSQGEEFHEPYWVEVKMWYIY